jgi:hypothetical protein
MMTFPAAFENEPESRAMAVELMCGGTGTAHVWSCSFDGTIVVVNASTKAVVARLPRFDDAVSCLHACTPPPTKVNSAKSQAAVGALPPSCARTIRETLLRMIGRVHVTHHLCGGLQRC